MDASLFNEIDDAWETAREQLIQEGVAPNDIEDLIPERILRNYNITLVDVYAAFVGYAIEYRGLPVIGINRNLEGLNRAFALLHEIGHVLRGHIYQCDYLGHSDSGLFAQEVYSPRIGKHEYEANMISADKCVKTDDVLEVIAYDCRTIKEYREVLEAIEDLADKRIGLLSSYSREIPYSIQEKLEEYDEMLYELTERKQELMEEISYMDLNLTFDGMADELGITPTILRYKLEAMRLRGFDISYQELERYDQIFKDFL